MTLPRLHTPEEVAEALGLPSTNWLEEAARAGRIRHIRLGRRLRFSDEQVAEIIEKHTSGLAPNPVPRPKTVGTPRGRTPANGDGPWRLPDDVRATF